MDTVSFDWCPYGECEKNLEPGFKLKSKITN